MTAGNAFNKSAQEALNDKFFIAVKEGSFQRADQYLALGANINARDENDDTMLTLAARENQTGTILMLILRKANLNAQDGQGNTALMWSVQNRNKQAATALIDSGVDINIENGKGLTAFKIAIQSRNRDLVELFEKPLKRMVASVSDVFAAAKDRNNRTLPASASFATPASGLATQSTKN